MKFMKKFFAKFNDIAKLESKNLPEKSPKLKPNLPLLKVFKQNWQENLITWANSNKIAQYEFTDGVWVGFPRTKKRIRMLLRLKLNLAKTIALPLEFTRLKKLKELSINGEFKGIKALGKLHNLKRLSLINCNLAEIPLEFMALKKLWRLNLSENNFKDLAKLNKLGYILSALPRLKELDLSDCDISDLPDSFANLQRLERLDLSQNSLQNLNHIVSVLAKLPRLTHLNLGACDLSYLPLEFATLHLTNLDIANNTSLANTQNGDFIGFGDAMSVICQIKWLKHLNLYNCALRDLPDNFASLTRLKNAFLDVNKFKNMKKITRLLSTLPRLEFVGLSECGLYALPRNFHLLRHILALNIADNPFLSYEQVAAKLSEFKALSFLWIGNENWGQFPQPLLSLQQIEVLILDNVKNFRRFPQNILEFDRLKILHIDKNIVPPHIKDKLNARNIVVNSGINFT